MTASISYDYFGIKPTFSTARELRDAMLASYPAADYLGGPITGTSVGYDIDTAPAWGWVKQLVRTRTDWWPAIGVALQHAARDGGALARQALADLVHSCDDSAALLPWIEPIATQWPDVVTSHASDTSGVRLDALIAARRSWLAEHQTTRLAIATDGADEIVEVTTSADLVPAMAITAKLGMPRISAYERGREYGTWTWLVTEAVTHPWSHTTIPDACARFAAGSDVEVRTMLGWFFDEHDLWRYRALIEGWRDHEPAWWNDSVKVRGGRRNPLDWKRLPDGVNTLGQVALRALHTGLRQHATPAILDLDANPPLGEPPHATPTRATASPQTPSPSATPSPASGGPRIPALTLAEHRAPIVQLLVLDRERVISVDADRVAIEWNPRSAAVIARRALPATAIANSVASTVDGLVFVSHDADIVTVHAIDDQRVLARVAAHVPSASIARCTYDLARVLIAHDGTLALFSTRDGTGLAKVDVETHDPDVLALEAVGGGYLVRFFHVGMDMYPTTDEALFDRLTLDEIDRRRGQVDVHAPLPPHRSMRVAIAGAVARVFDGERSVELVAHERPICFSTWIEDVLVTGDDGGTIHAWTLDPAS